LSNLLAK